MFTLLVKPNPRAWVLVGAVLAFFVLAGCKTDNVKQTTHPTEKDWPVPSTGLVTNGCDDPARQRLIASLTNELNIVLLTEWCLERLKESSDAPADEVQILEMKPEFMQLTNAECGSPEIVVWRDTSEVGPSVMFLWRHQTGRFGGLIVSGPEFTPTASWLKTEEIRPGVFTFSGPIER